MDHLTRRTFLAFLGAPAIVRATSLMPVFPERVWIEPGLYSVAVHPEQGAFLLTDFEPTGQLGEMLVTQRVRVPSRAIFEMPAVDGGWTVATSDKDHHLRSNPIRYALQAIRYALQANSDIARDWACPGAPVEFVTQTDLRLATGSIDKPFVPTRFRAPWQRSKPSEGYYGGTVEGRHKGLAWLDG